MFTSTDMNVHDHIIMHGDLKDRNFVPDDISGRGFGVYTDSDGNRVIEADVLVGRLGARFSELKVYETEHLGGTFIYSNASIRISTVSDSVSGYICEFDTQNNTVKNKFQVGDGAFCQRHEDSGYRYYWMRVRAIGDSFIELDADDSDMSDFIPMAGDIVIQLGHISDPGRQNAIIISTSGTDAPRLSIYSGIDGFSLSGKDLGGWKYDIAKSEMLFYGYGSMYFGDISQDGHFISYDKASRTFRIQAAVSIGKGSSGLEDFDEWPDKQAQMDKVSDMLSKINDDTVLDKAEKYRLCSEWEKINGASSLSSIGSSGSYRSTLNIVASRDQSTNETDLVFGEAVLQFNTRSLKFNYWGTEGLTAAYFSLRDYLIEIELYKDEEFGGFDREKLSGLFTAYYDAQTILLNSSRPNENLRDQMAHKLGYTGWADLVECAAAGKTIIQGGYINTELIKAKAITAAMIAVEDLFAQDITATKLTLGEGCRIGSMLITAKGIGIDSTDVLGSLTISEQGIMSSGVLHGVDEQPTIATIGNCAGTAISALAGTAASLHCTTFNNKAIGLEVGADEDGAAIVCDRGMFAGLRPCLRCMEAGEICSLSSRDNVVITPSGTIGLPDIGFDRRAPFAQHIRIIHTSATLLEIDSSLDIVTIGSQSTTRTIASTKSEIIELIFNGSQWLRLS